MDITINFGKADLQYFVKDVCNNCAKVEQDDELIKVAKKAIKDVILRIIASNKIEAYKNMLMEDINKKLEE